MDLNLNYRLSSFPVSISVYPTDHFFIVTLNTELDYLCCPRRMVVTCLKLGYYREYNTDDTDANKSFGGTELVSRIPSV